MQITVPAGKKLYAHQTRFLQKNPDRALLLHETGLGKSVTAMCWMRMRPDRKALVCCPKSIMDKWKRDLIEWGCKADVISRDGVKKIDMSSYKVLVLDEAQDYASPLFAGGRSQRATKIYNFIKGHPDAHVLLLTATPIRSTAWNCHTLACYLRTFWKVTDFRDKFYYFTDMFGRFHWEPKKTWRKDIRPYLESISDIVLARDCADIPKQTHRVVTIPWTYEQEAEFTNACQTIEPAGEWHLRHRMEQCDTKFTQLQAIMDGYRKIIVVCYYRAQIDDYIARIGNERQVFVLHGGVRDQDGVIKAAREADDCVFLLQASMGAGFDASEFSVMVFASMSFKFVDYVQSLGRINRINNLHENDYMYLIGGECDRMVYKTILAGNDFHPPAYMNR